MAKQWIVLKYTIIIKRQAVTSPGTDVYPLKSDCLFKNIIHA
jgi:hypothetical protein